MPTSYSKTLAIYCCTDSYNITISKSCPLTIVYTYRSLSLSLSFSLSLLVNRQTTLHSDLKLIRQNDKTFEIPSSWYHAHIRIYRNTLVVRLGKKWRNLIVPYFLYIRSHSVVIHSYLKVCTELFHFSSFLSQLFTSQESLLFLLSKISKVPS